MLQQEPTPPPPPPAAAAAAAREHEDHHHPQQQQQQQQVLKGGGGKGDSLLAAAAPPAVVPPETPAAAPAAAAAGVGAGAPAALQLLQQQPQPLPTSSAVSRPPPVPPGPLRLGVSPESSMAPSGAPSPTISMTAGMTPQSSPRDGGHGTLTFDSLTVNDPMEGAAAASAGAAEMHAPAATTIGGTKRTLPDGVAAAKQPSKRATSGTTGSVVPPGGVIPGHSSDPFCSVFASCLHAGAAGEGGNRHASPPTPIRPSPSFPPGAFCAQLFVIVLLFVVGCNAAAAAAACGLNPHLPVSLLSLLFAFDCKRTPRVSPFKSCPRFTLAWPDPVWHWRGIAWHG
eukprot:jgi/Mesen1/4775/ME000242S03949